MPNTSRVLSFPSPGVFREHLDINAPGDETLLGPSSAIARVWSQIRRIAPHFRAAMVTGEPGCGAEAVGRALHMLSPVCHLPFSDLDAQQAEQALRSHGSSALQRTEGLVFLNQVERLSQEAQRALLRKLRLRGHPLRVVGASGSDLRSAVSAGHFSAELAEALTAIRIALPPLRERKEDIPLLAVHVAQRAATRLGIKVPKLADSFHEAVSAFEWPGNLDQLEAMMQQLLSGEHADTLTDQDFTAAIASAAPMPVREEPAPARMVPLESIVQEHIRAVLVACNGNKLRAAETLGISRSTLYRMLDCYNPSQHQLPLAG